MSKKEWKMGQIFMAFSEYRNFNKYNNNNPVLSSLSWKQKDLIVPFFKESPST